MQEIASHFRRSEHVELSLVTGGLMYPARKTGPDFAAEKRPIASRVEQKFGVKFADDYFSNVLGSGHLDSLVPCQFINAAEMIAPETTFDFAARLINAAFIEARNISDMSVCFEVSVESGFDMNEVEALVSSEQVRQKTKTAFGFAKKVGTGFPSLFIEINDEVSYLGGSDLELSDVKACVTRALVA